MARYSPIQHAFNAGELSPLMLGRQDIDKYAHGLYTCFNAVPITQGGWTRRPGTVYMHQCRHHDKEARLFPFQYSITQTYILEFGNLYIRFFSSHGILTNASQSITSISKASTGKLTKASHGYTDGQRVYLSSVVGMTQLNGREVVVTNKTANDFDLYDTDGVAINTTAYDTFTSGNMATIYEVTTGYTEAQLPDIRITQSADTLFILHPDKAPAKLVRNSALSWTLSDITFVDGPYDAINTTTTTLTPSAATGTVTITASAVTGINSNLGFLSGDVGRFIRMQQGSVWGYVQVLTVASTVSLTANVLSTLTSTAAKTNWRMGIWSTTTGFPTTGTFYEDRLFLAGAELYPQRLDGSKSGNYYSYAPSLLADGTVAADNAVAFTLNADDVNAVQWMKPHEKGLLVGTSRGEWQVKASSLNEAITPTNISAKFSTHYGSASVEPVTSGRAVIFVQRANRKIRELAYVFEVDGFKAPDMTLLAEHVTRTGVTELDSMEQPYPIVWAVRTDGILLGMTYDRDQDVVAWHRHELGGYSNAGHTAAPLVESLAVVPSPDATHDELYLIVKRYINGGTKRYVEYMSPFWEQDDAQEDAFFLDCGTSVTNAPAASTFTGLWHLEGETLSFYADGHKHPDVTVTNGKVTHDHTYSVASIGYAYNSDGQTLPIEAGAQDGTAQGKTKRINKIGFWLVDTLGLKYGPDADNLTEILVRKWGDDYGVATPLFTGVVKERFEGDYDKLGQIYWRADGPFPATILAVMPQVQTSDDS